MAGHIPGLGDGTCGGGHRRRGVPSVGDVPDRVVNLCFHGVGAPRRPLEPGEDRYWTEVDDHLRLLDAVVGRPEVRLSYDDGNWSDVEHALPALLERGLTATFFVIAGRLGEPGSLDEDAVRHLHAHGMAVGNHGMDHRSWRTLTPVTAERELTTARERLAAVVGAPVDLAAMPRGQYDRRALRRLRRSSYTTVFSSDRAPAREDGWLQARYSVRRDTPVVPALARRPARAIVGWSKRLR